MFKINNKRHQKDISWHEHTVDIALMSSFLTLNIFCLLFYCFLCWLYTSKCRLGILLISAGKYCDTVFWGVESSIQRYLWKSLCFSLLLFTVWWSTFKKPFRRLLPLVFMDQVNGCSKPKLFVKEQVSFKIKSDLAMYVPYKFCYPSFLLWSIFSSPVDVELK